MTASSPDAQPAREHPVSAWAPLKRPLFLALWIATVVSNIGTWMQNAAAGWLMTDLSPTPLIVALVQVAASAPMFLLGLPAGALADILDRRRLLIVMQVVATIIVAVLAGLVTTGQVTPTILLVFTFLVAAASALIAPAWQAIVPQLVPREELAAGISLNSVGFNVSRAIGPALAGVMIGVLGMAAPFWINAASNLGVIAILVWWRAGSAQASRLPAEGFIAAMRVGLRHARDNPHLKATLVRTAAFFLLASAYWALLPLVARTQVQGGPGLYGMLLGAIGAGAVAGAFLLPRLKARLGADRLAVAGTLGTAAATLLFGWAQHVTTALVASALAGVSWIAVLATINVSAQVALPAWVRGRGLALFGTVQFGALTAGSLLWGGVASASTLSVAHFAAAGALLVSIPLLKRWKLQTAAGLDLTPSMHWPAPVMILEEEADRGPVLVTVEYQVDPGNRAAFLSAIAQLGAERRRDGAFSWQLFEDAARAGRFVETFYVESWRDHLRQHERVTHADREVQQAVTALHAGGTPEVRHLIAVASPDPR